jgi:hypothetical protein
MEKQPLAVKAFGGINKLHTRELGQASEGRNFWTRNGVLFTREGCSLLAGTPFTGTIRSVHSAARAQMIPRLLVEAGTGLWRYNTLDWTQLLSDVSGNGFSSTMYYDHLILVNGSQKYAYDVAADSIAPLQNLEGGSVPDMEFITVHKDILFGWAPHFAPADTIHFNGYEKDADGKILGRSKDSWPPDFAIRVPDGSGSPVMACIPAGTHLLILTQRSYWLLYGDNEDNFSLVPGGAIGVYSERCVAKVGDYAIWLGEDDHGAKRVYAYSGTQPYVISQPVEELLNNMPSAAFAWVKTYGFGTKFWLLLPDTQANTTKAFVFDIEEKQWYVHEFPASFMCACLYDGRIYFGANDGRVAFLDENATTDFGHPITTEFKIGPMNTGDGRKFKVKRLWVNAEPRNGFSLDVYVSSDAGDESGPYSVTFEAGGQKTAFVKPRAGHKGKDIYLRVTTTDRINELQAFSLTVVPKSLK